jgi:hypothetical protein
MPFGWGKGHQRVNSDALDSDTLAEAKSGFSTIQCNFTIPDNEPLGNRATAHQPPLRCEAASDCMLTARLRHQPVGLQRD